MQTTLSSIWNQFAMSISGKNNHYTKRIFALASWLSFSVNLVIRGYHTMQTFKYIYIYIYIYIEKNEVIKKKVKLATFVGGYPKAPFSIATAYKV